MTCKLSWESQVYVVSIVQVVISFAWNICFVECFNQTLRSRCRLTASGAMDGASGADGTSRDMTALDGASRADGTSAHNICEAIALRSDRIAALNALDGASRFNGLSATSDRSTLRSKRFNLLYNVHTIRDLAKHTVFAIQPASLSCAQKELGPVGVGAGVSHGKDTGTGVLQTKVFVLKLVTVDGLSSSSVVVGKVSTLAHESRDDSVEGGSLVSETLLTSAQSPEVFSSLGDYIRSKLHDNSAEGCSISRDVEKYLSHFWIFFW